MPRPWHSLLYLVPWKCHARRTLLFRTRRASYNFSETVACVRKNRLAGVVAGSVWKFCRFHAFLDASLAQLQNQSIMPRFWIFGPQDKRLNLKSFNLAYKDNGNKNQVEEGFNLKEYNPLWKVKIWLSAAITCFTSEICTLDNETREKMCLVDQRGRADANNGCKLQ